jgi:hypothetical protein
VTEQHRTVAAERDLPRVRQWIDDAVRHAVNEAAQALHTIRYWCDHEAEVAESLIAEGGCCGEDGSGEPCPLCIRANETRLNAIREVRALLPALPDLNRRAEHGGEDGDARHASDPGRPGLVTEDEPGGSETGGGFNP